jgi:hypothetical protein
MWKIVVVLLILVMVGIFIPRYNLEKRKAMLSDEFELATEGYWSREKCNEEGKKFEHGYRCIKTSAWRSMVGSQRAYNKERGVE